MAAKSPTQYHAHWGSYASPAQLPNALGATKQDPALEAGDLAYSVSDTTPYVCTNPTIGAAVWTTMGGGGGGGASEEQIFSIAMLMGQEPPIVPDPTDLDKQTYRIVVGNAAAGDSAENCDYLDIGDGAQLQAALTAAGLTQSEVFVRSGTYNLGLAGSPAELLDVPFGVRVIGAGRGQVTIVTRDGGDGCAFYLWGANRLEEMRIYCTAPTTEITGYAAIIYGFGVDGCELRALDIVFPDWSGVDPVDVVDLWAAILIDGPALPPNIGDVAIIDCTIQNVPSDASTLWMEGFCAQSLETVSIRNLLVTGSAISVDIWACYRFLMNQFDLRDFDYQGLAIVGTVVETESSAHVSEGFLQTDHANLDRMVLWSRMTGGSLHSITISTLGETLYEGIRLAYGGGHSLVSCNSRDGLYTTDFLTISGSAKNIVCACNMESNTYVDSVDFPPTILGDSEIVHCFSGGRSWP